MQPSFFRTALILGLLAAIGPFAIDMYLPAMPEIGTALGASVPAMQGTLTAYFIAFGLAQMVYGPWADQAGRKPPLYAGIAVFALGTLICLLAPTAGWLTAGRAVQGLGGAALMVVPRAVIRDLYTGSEATRLMAAVMLVISVSPMLAPLAGAGLIAVADWRAIFGALLIASAASLMLVHFAQGETLRPENRQRFDAPTVRRGVRRLLADRGFMALTFLGGFGFASFFVFLASATFVYTGYYGLTPTGFSLAFAVNAIGFFAASQAAGPLGARHGAARVMAVAAAGFAAATVTVFGLVLAGVDALWVVIGGLVIANAFLGLIIPTAMVMALDPLGEIAGLASSLGGTLQMLAGGLMIAALGPVFDGTPEPMLGAIALCGVLVLALSRAVAGQAAAASATADRARS
jgi:MFS transporter, DHA1 family, multidrug resistance protein